MIAPNGITTAEFGIRNAAFSLQCDAIFLSLTRPLSALSHGVCGSDLSLAGGARLPFDDLAGRVVVIRAPPHQQGTKIGILRVMKPDIIAVGDAAELAAGTISPCATSPQPRRSTRLRKLRL